MGADPQLVAYINDVHDMLMYIFISVLLALCLFIIDKTHDIFLVLFPKLPKHAYYINKAEELLSNLDIDSTLFEDRLIYEENPVIKNELMNSIAFNKVCREDIMNRLKQFQTGKKRDSVCIVETIN